MYRLFGSVAALRLEPGRDGGAAAATATHQHASYNTVDGHTRTKAPKTTSGCNSKITPVGII